MCGIVYRKDFRGKNVTEKVKARYKAQRSRGTQGFGYYIPKTNRLTHNPDEMKLLNNLIRQDASEVLFHHRFPTSTANVQNACHPFSTKWDGFKHNYVMVHNGWLTNDKTLAADHAELGINYVSKQADGRFNDSEALLYDIALYLEGQQEEIKAKGAVAFVVIERDEKGEPVRLLWGRNTNSPLKFQFKKNKFMSLASEGDGTDVVPHMLNEYDYATGVFSAQALDIARRESWYEMYGGGRSYSSYTGPSTTTFGNSQSLQASSLGENYYSAEDDDYYPRYSNGKSMYGASSRLALGTGSDGESISLDYDYYDSQSNHMKGNTGSTGPATLCHFAGMPCPKAIAKAKASTRADKVEDYSKLAIRKADYDLEQAITDCELELERVGIERSKLRARLVKIDNDSTKVEEFLEKSDLVETLNEEYAVLLDAIEELAICLDNFQINQTKMDSLSDEVKEKLAR